MPNIIITFTADVQKVAAYQQGIAWRNKPIVIQCPTYPVLDPAWPPTISDPNWPALVNDPSFVPDPENPNQPIPQINNPVPQPQIHNPIPQPPNPQTLQQYAQSMVASLVNQVIADDNIFQGNQLILAAQATQDAANQVAATTLVNSLAPILALPITITQAIQ